MGNHKEENNKTRVGSWLQGLGDIGKPILKAAAGLTGQGWLNTVANGITTSKDIDEAKTAEGLSLCKMDNEDRANSRDMNVHIQESVNASFLAKNTAYVLDLGIFVLIFLIIGGLFFIKIPIGNKEILYLIVGTILGYMGATWAFHRGSSQGSKDKTNGLLKTNKF